MPTIKQKLAFDKIVENRGNVSAAMREVGYSDNSAKNPSNLTDSDGWKDLMETYLPDSLLWDKHKKLLEKQEVVLKNNNKTGKIEVIKTGEIDVQAVGKGLDMAYKLKRKYGEDAPPPGATVNFNLSISAQEISILKAKVKEKQLQK